MRQCKMSCVYQYECHFFVGFSEAFWSILFLLSFQSSYHERFSILFHPQHQYTMHHSCLSLTLPPNNAASSIPTPPAPRLVFFLVAIVLQHSWSYYGPLNFPFHICRFLLQIPPVTLSHSLHHACTLPPSLATVDPNHLNSYIRYISLFTVAVSFIWFCSV